VLSGSAPRLAALLATQSEAFWATALLAGMVAGTDLLGPGAIDVTNPRVLEFINSYKFKFLAKVQETTSEEFTKLLLQAQAEGWSVTKFRDELRSKFNTWGKQRSELIARSEIIRSSNHGAKLSYVANGITEMRWFDTDDSRVCPFCNALDGTIISMTETFANVGDVIEGIDPKTGSLRTMTVTYEAVEVPPVHPGCRCTVLPVIN
jgi:SPP1 gp7 family putative phage head morphogenesis protein